MPQQYSLSPQDKTAITKTVNDLAHTYRSVEEPEFLANVNIYAHELPRDIRKFLNDFRLGNDASDYAVISGCSIDNATIGPTPSHWDHRPAVSPTLKEEIYTMLLGALVGDAFGWATQQEGYICNDLLPIKGLELEQVGASSECVLAWHIEDAFHPYRGDYVQLICLRNPDNTATTIGALDISLLSDDVIDLLFEARFAIKPDHAHKADFKGRNKLRHRSEKDRLEASYAAISKVDRDPPKIPLLYGRRDAPSICIDPFYMDHPAEDREGIDALQALIQALECNLEDVALQPGDVAILDNARLSNLKYGNWNLM
ncbi:MAG: arginine beta-hydroxylase, Fe(II)/alpha-ketoglutarate-dependent [Planctomycetes bacterium]|nr:arginine beta-hydroxylase, Fe(II)/alpha-ketoglutarate-dependent [Planctomycetota bacterium]